MKLGIVGFSQSGKSTVFEALTKNTIEIGNKSKDHIAAVRVPDVRVDFLSNMYKPKKTIYAQVEYFLPGIGAQSKDKNKEQNIWTKTRDCDALIHVVRNFAGFGFDKSEPFSDFVKLDQEFIIEDFVVIEKRLERLEQDMQRSRDVNKEEVALLKECLDSLEKEIPLRKNSDLSSAHILKGYAFVSAKPKLVLFNNEDDDYGIPDAKDDTTFKEDCMVIRGKLEQELAQMSVEDTEDFLNEFNITASAMDRVIKRSYALLGLISFFTVGEDEVRAWTIKKGATALDAAGVIHTDFRKGFIRAEVLSYNDLMDAGTYNEARKKGTVRLEGKEHYVQDGDIINFRFNV
ncbi:MAG: redox-regulated ATPase YchF [Desulfobacteraceae bacterium]|nr:redox-regulated ATPase YchF [Desulfobacteraceae bacterium]MBC2719685.1 redox-regulated ATPase YchF [Desulfobacteraceae bacterium]